MKKIILSIVAGLLAVFSASAYAATFQFSYQSGYTGWRCEVSDRGGRAWYSIASSQGQARAAAYRLCRYNSYYWRTCTVNFCNFAQRSYAPQYGGAWQCNARNWRGDVWFGIAGSQYNARVTAMNYCASNSYNPSTCRVTACFRR